MKILKYLLLLPGISLLIVSCSTSPEPIRYGEDSCHYCEMTIVSQAHSAQAVSTKGKQFKYDAIECMVNDLNSKETEMSIKQVADFRQPGNMIQVENAGFIINDSINSPMGANLAAIKTRQDGGGDLYTWSDLKAKFLNEDSMSLNH